MWVAIRQEFNFRWFWRKWEDKIGITWHLEVAQTVEEEGVRKDTHTELGVCRDFRTSLNVSRKIWVS